jgi:putative colanic acid biosynthesis acetyltransferase WcaF
VSDRLPASDVGMRDARTSPHSRSERLGRLLWGFVQATFFRLSPRPMHAWRRFLLRAFGASVHATARVYPRARIWAPRNLVLEEYATIADDVEVYSVARIRIGASSTVSQFAHLCAATHDFERIDFPLVAMPISIGRRCWIAAEVFVGPGVSIGDGTVVGARSAVFGDLPGWKVCVGSPARPIRDRVLSTNAESGQLSSEPAA